MFITIKVYIGLKPYSTDGGISMSYEDSRDSGQQASVLHCHLWPWFKSHLFSISSLLPLPFINDWQTSPFNLFSPNSQIRITDSRLLLTSQHQSMHVEVCSFTADHGNYFSSACILVVPLPPSLFYYFKPSSPIFWFISWVKRFNCFILALASATFK